MLLSKIQNRQYHQLKFGLISHAEKLVQHVQSLLYESFISYIFSISSFRSSVKHFTPIVIYKYEIFQSILLILP